MNWLITGASSGLGLALACAALEQGDRVAATVRRAGALDALAEAHGDRLWVGHAEMTDPASIRRAVAGAFDAFGTVDTVVSNAAYGLFGAAEEATDEQVDDQLAANLAGSIHLFRAVVPALRGQGGGRFVQVSSMGAQLSFPGMSVYHATKWGIEGFLEAAAYEVAASGIAVLLVEPGSIKTEFTGAHAVTSAALPAYAGTPVGALRGVVEGGSVVAVGDPARMACAILDAAAGPVACGPAQRLVLGSDAFKLMRAALRRRLEQVEACRDTASATDA